MLRWALDKTRGRKGKCDEECSLIRKWDIQADAYRWFLNLGVHVDPSAPEVSLFVGPFVLTVGRLEWPGWRFSVRRIVFGDPDTTEQ